MYTAIRGALTLALTIIVLQIFLPELAQGVIQIVLKLVELALMVLNQAPSTLAQ